VHKILTLIASGATLGAILKTLLSSLKSQSTDAIEHSALMGDLIIQFILFLGGFAALALGYWGLRQARKTGAKLSPIFSLGIFTGLIAALCVLIL